MCMRDRNECDCSIRGTPGNARHKQPNCKEVFLDIINNNQLRVPTGRNLVTQSLEFLYTLG